MYRVIWQIAVDADTPFEAAQLARYWQTLPETTATIFDVETEDGEPCGQFDLSAE